MNEPDGGQDYSDSRTTSDIESPRFEGDGHDCCRSRLEGATERQDWRNGRDQEKESTENRLCLGQGVDARQQEAFVPGVSTSLSTSIQSGEGGTTAPQGSLDGEVQTRPPAGRKTEGSVLPDELSECNQRRDVHSHLVGPATTTSTPESILTDSSTRLRSTKREINVNGDNPVTLSSWDDRKSGFGEQNPELLPTEIPTGGTSTEVSTELNSDETVAVELVAATFLAPSVSQSTESVLATHSATTEWHGNHSSGAVGGPTSSVPGQVSARSSTGQVPGTPLPDDVVATWERALAVTLATSSYSSTSPMETLSNSSTHAFKTSSLQASSRLSGVMCRSIDAVQTQPFSGGDPGLSFGVDGSSRPIRYWVRVRATDTRLDSADKKPTTVCGRFALFALIVSLVTGVTIAGAVFASRGSPSSSGSASSSPCNSKGTASALLPAMVREIKEDNRTDIADLQEWHSTLESGSAFGEFVSLSEDGSVMVIAERVNTTASAVYVVPATSTLQALNLHSVVFLEALVTSLALNYDGTVFAVGLSTGLTEVYNQDKWCRSQWRRMGDSVGHQGGATLRSSSLLANYTTSVSISADGTVIAVGLVTSSNAAHYQVLRFHKGKWQPRGQAIEYGDDGSFAHTSARVSLSANCTSRLTTPCILATSRMFSYEQFSFGMISVRKMSQDETSWDTLGQAIPFALEEATAELASNGTTLSVSDAASTTVYRLSYIGTRAEWVQVGQRTLPRASSIAVSESGERLTFSVNNTIVVYELRQDSANGSIRGPDWNEVHQIPIQSASAEDDVTGSFLRLAMGHRCDRIVVGDPFFPTTANESPQKQGRVLVMSF